MPPVVTETESLANFKRQTAEFLRRLRASGEPVVLTVDGQAQVVVQDAQAYQKLLESTARRAQDEAVAAVREGLDDVQAGRTRPARAAIQKVLKKRGFKAPRRA